MDQNSVRMHNMGIIYIYIFYVNKHTRKDDHEIKNRVRPKCRRAASVFLLQDKPGFSSTDNLVMGPVLGTHI
jgi:hypothetical protein